MVLPILLLVAVAFAVSLPLSALLVRTGHRMGTLDSPGSVGHAKQLRAVPNIGGLAIFAAIAGPLIVGLLAAHVIPAGRWIEWIPALAAPGDNPLANVERALASTPDALGLIACAALLHVVGVLDDRRGLSPWSKLLAQLVAAGTMVVLFDVRLLTLLPTPVSIVISILWIVVITNAMSSDRSV